jgi:hypothetical protein
MGAVMPGREQRTAAIRRITQERKRWRVLVQTWREPDAFRGRLLFEPEGVQAGAAGRQSPVVLTGQTLEDVVAHAYDLTEERLGRLLRSLG